MAMIRNEVKRALTVQIPGAFLRLMVFVYSKSASKTLVTVTKDHNVHTKSLISKVDMKDASAFENALGTSNLVKKFALGVVKTLEFVETWLKTLS